MMTGTVCQIMAARRAPCQSVKVRLTFDTLTQCQSVKVSKFRTRRGPPRVSNSPKKGASLVSVLVGRGSERKTKCPMPLHGRTLRRVDTSMLLGISFGAIGSGENIKGAIALGTWKPADGIEPSRSLWRLPIIPLVIAGAEDIFVL